MRLRPNRAKVLRNFIINFREVRGVNLKKLKYIAYLLSYCFGETFLFLLVGDSVHNARNHPIVAFYKFLCPFRVFYQINNLFSWWSKTHRIS